MTHALHTLIRKIQTLSHFSTGEAGAACSLFEAIPTGILIQERNGKIIYLNKIAKSLLEAVFFVNEACSRTFDSLKLSITHPSSPPRSYQALASPAATSELHSHLAEVDFHWGDRTLTLLVNITPIRDTDNQVTHAILVLHKPPHLPQISMEAMLGPVAPSPDETTHALGAALTSQLPGGLYTLSMKADHAFRFEYLNAWFEHFYGASLPQIYRHPERYILEQMHPDDRSGFWAAIATSAQTQNILSYEWRSISPHGEMRWLKTQAQPQRRHHGEICWRGLILDISDSKFQALALQESEVQHRAIVNALPDLMFRVSRTGMWMGYVHTNALIDYLPEGYDPTGHHITDHMPPDIAYKQLEMIQQALATNQTQIFEQQLAIEGRLQHEEVRVVPWNSDEVLFIVRDISDRKLAELALQEREAENRAIVTAIPDLMFRLHRDGTYLNYFNEKYGEDLLAPENPVGRNIREFATTEHLKAHFDQQMQAVHQALVSGKIQIYEQMIPGENTQHYEEVRIVPIQPDEVLVIVRNIGDRKRTELALQQSEARNQAILRAIPDLMLRVHRNGTLLDSLGNSQFPDLLAKIDNRVGRKILELATDDYQRRHLEQKMRAVQRALDTGEMQIYEQEVLIDEQWHYEEVRIVPSGADEVLIMIRDVSDRKRVEAALRHANERLERLSLTDPLTNLANRRSLDDYLQREWRRAMREQKPVSFILFDLDHFKRFNDTYGHQVGDECLARVSQAVVEVVNRGSDLVARYGGEEFAITLANTDLKGAYQIAERIRMTILDLQIPHQSSLVNSWVTASVGVSSMVPLVGSQPNQLIRQADQALYAAKQAGRNNCQCFIRLD